MESERSRYREGRENRRNRSRERRPSRDREKRRENEKRHRSKTREDKQKRSRSPSVLPIHKWKRKLNNWDVKPPGYEGMTAKQVKDTGKSKFYFKEDCTHLHLVEKKMSIGVV